MDDKTFCSVEDVVAYIKKQSIKMIDLKLVDMMGRMHHLTLPASGVSADLFRHGFGFDGSSYAGFRSVEAGDLCMILGAGYPFFRGGITKHLDQSGVAQRVLGHTLGGG